MMKTIRLLTRTLTLTLTLTLIALLMTLTAFSAHAKNGPDSPEEQLRDKITQLIRKPDLKLVPIHERDVSVEFIVTRDNKILVLDIETFNQVLDKYIKHKLNYHVISVKGIRKMTPYRIDLTFEVK